MRLDLTSYEPSHAANTNESALVAQDQMRIVKSRFSEVLPGLSIFLDVDIDNLLIDDLEGYIDSSATVLVFCSSGYFQSKNCLRELRRAVEMDKHIIALLEPSVKRGGLTVTEARAQLEVEQEDGGALADALFAHEPIEWSRFGIYQDITMRLIASRLLPPPVPEIYITGELMLRRTKLRMPSVQLSLSLRLSVEGHRKIIGNITIMIMAILGQKM